MKQLILFILLIICLNGNAFCKEEKGIFQSEKINPVKIENISDKHFLFDFGKDAFGTLLLKFEAPQNDTIIIHLGEKLNANGSIDRDPGGTIRYRKVILPKPISGSEIVLQLPPDQRNTSGQAISLPDSFGVIIPFRYCEFENLKVPLNKVSVRQKIYHYRFNEDASYFESSDTVLNQIWDLCKHTIKATSFAGVYIDGDRERIPYEADAYINQLSHYSVDNEYGMAKETIKHFMKNPTWPTEWLLHTILMVYQDYYYTGNTELLSKYYDQLKEKTLYALADENGFISTSSDKITGEYMKKLGFSDTTQRLNDIVDWPPAQKDTGWKLATAEGERDGHEMMPVNTVVNCFFYENMRIMAELAEKLNRKNDARFFTQMAEMVKKSINNILLDKEKGIYLDGIGSKHSSIHSNMLPLAFGIVPNIYVQPVAEFVKSRKMACSVYGAQYLLEGLYRAGEDDYAMDLMTSTADRSWWNMIRSGSTMAWEAWDAKYKPNLDWNHAWGTAPGNIITRFMWGIQPAEPGFDKVRIYPQMGDLINSKIKVPTKTGAIYAEYEKMDKNKKHFIVKLPKEMKGQFMIKNFTDRTKVFINQKAVSVKNGSISINSGQNIIIIVN